MKLLDQVRRACRTKHLSLSTEQAYVRWTRRYVRYHGLRHPHELTEADSTRRQRHLTTLAAMVAGIVAAGSSQLPKMAQKAPDKTKTESRVKRFTRFIQNA